MRYTRAIVRHLVVLLAAAGGACDKGPSYGRPPANEYTVSSMTLSGPPSVETVLVAAVTPEFLRVTGVRALLGRLFIAEEFRQPETRTVVISDALWRRRFGGDPRIIGRQIQLGGQSVVVVGVTPTNFDVPPGAAVWLPRQLNQ